jgi:deoxycytidine triphosphate deaminase
MGRDVRSQAINTYNVDGINEIIPPGMLSSPQIAYCIDKFKIIENADMSCLDSATYHMRIGGETLTWKDGIKEEYILGEKEDRSRNILNKITLRPNSLTFVTTIEKFNLPKDIIARFNLKSKLIHQGLLLGTGPIVDPELKAHLLIPLHNFSNNDIELKWGSKIISVEFTKTMNPDWKLDDFKYIFNDNWNFDFHKYRARIGEKKVESSVSSAFDKYDKSIEGYKSRIRTFNIIGSLTAFGTAIGLIVLVFTTWMLLDSTFKKLDDASSVIKQYKDQGLDFRAFALAGDQEQIKKSVESNEKLISKISNTLERVSENYTITIDNAEKTKILQEQVADLNNKIEQLEKKNKNSGQ